MTTDQTCGNCRFLQALPNYPYSQDGYPSQVTLVCRRFPPTLSKHNTYSLYPVVGPNDWCGEWQERASGEPPKP